MSAAPSAAGLEPEGAPRPDPSEGVRGDPAPATVPRRTAPIPTFPEVWSRRHDLPGLPWAIAKGIAKGVVLIFVTVLLPIEILFTILGPSDLLLPPSFSVELLVVGGGALAITSAGSTAFRTTRAYGILRVANRAALLTYEYLLATLAVVAFGPYTIPLAIGTGAATFHLNFAEVLYLFMIPTALGLAAAIATLVEDISHPGERLPWDFPISRRTRRLREQELAAYLRVPPPP